MTQINWGLLQAPNVADKVWEGFERGQRMAEHQRQMRDQRDLRKALATLDANPNDPEARRTAAMLSPQSLYAMEDAAHQRGERQRGGEFRNALSDYLTSPNGAPASAGSGPVPGSAFSTPGAPTNALLGPLMGGAQNGAQAGGAAIPPGFGGVNALLSGGTGAAALPAPPTTALSPSAPAAGPSAFERMARADPAKAMEVQSKRMELTKDQFEMLRGVNEASLQLLGGVYDQATYEAALQRAKAMYGNLGLDLSALNLPEQYDPRVVDGLMRQSMKTRDQFEVMLKEDRLDWDIEDDIADNESIDGYRQGQLANTRRGQDLTHSRGIRGQDLTDRRGRRGQDIRSQDTRRGQDLTDKRGRESASFTGGGRGRGRGRGGNSSAPRARNAQGQEIQWNGKAWVPVQ